MGDDGYPSSPIRAFPQNDLWGGLELNLIFAIMLLLLITV